MSVPSRERRAGAKGRERAQRGSLRGVWPSWEPAGGVAVLAARSPSHLLPRPQPRKLRLGGQTWEVRRLPRVAGEAQPKSLPHAVFALTALLPKLEKRREAGRRFDGGRSSGTETLCAFRQREGVRQKPRRVREQQRGKGTGSPCTPGVSPRSKGASEQGSPASCARGGRQAVPLQHHLATF